MLKRSAIRLLLFVAALVWSAAAEAAPATWRVKGAAGEAVILGSMHMLTRDAQWRTPAVDAALARATSVWFEVPLDAAGKAQAAQAAAASGRLPPGERLSGLLGGQSRARLARMARDLLIPAEALEGLRPWLAETMISLAWIERQGGRQAFGVDEQVWSLAPPGARKRAFETAGQQVAMVAEAPMADQVASLSETLRMLETEPGAFATLQRAFLAPDLATLQRENVDALREVSPVLYRRLVADRNHRWAESIERLLKSPERAFIVVGVGHLVGPDGLPALLRRRGLVVEGP